MGDLVASLRHDLTMLACCRQAGDPRSEAVALINVGVAYLRFGAYPEARLHLEASLRFNRELGNRVVEGGSLAGLSELALREGDAATALAQAQQALEILVAADSRLYQIDALHNLGNALFGLERWAEAHEAFARDEALAREIEVSNKVTNALEGQARVALARGDPAAAAAAVDRLLVQVGAGDAMPATAALVGTDDHGVRLTLCQVWRRTGDARVGTARVVAQRALFEAADAITDAALRQSFLTLVPENREIAALGGEAARLA